MKRRAFLSVSAGAVAVSPFVFTKRSSLWAAGTLSPIAIVYNPLASTYVGRADGTNIGTYTVNSGAIKGMVDAAVMRLTGQATVGLAWESVVRAKVPTLAATTKIGIKINTSYVPGSGLPPSASGYTADKRCPYMARGEVVEAIVSGLGQMLGGTYKVENVTAFDRFNQNAMSTYMPAHGFPVGGSNTAYDVGGSSGKYRAFISPTASVGTAQFTLGPFSSKNTTTTQTVLKVVTDQACYINLAIPKINIGSGTTASLKNAYGMTNNCGATHPMGGGVGDVIHDCAPRFYQQIDSLVPCILNVLDGLAGNYALQVYAGYSFVANKIAVTTDPITLEFLGNELVNQARAANGWAAITTPAITADRYGMHGAQYPGTSNVSSSKTSLDDINTTYSTYVNCHAPAIGESLGLGNLNAGERLEINQTGISSPGELASLERAQGRPLEAIRNGSAWRLKLQFDNSGRTHRVESRILDIHGRVVRSLADQATPYSRFMLEWDGRTETGLSTPAGVYCWETRIDGIAHSQTLHQ